jgi:UDPglucose 6-dehydrogenase
LFRRWALHIAVVGTGYVGLVTGVCFSEFGVYVTCVDNDKGKVESLKKGVVPFYEPGLDDMVKRNYAEGRLKFTDEIAEAIEESLVIFIAVGTPPLSDGSADLSYVDAVAKEIAQHIKSYKVIVTKSTVPVGTGERLRKIISENLKQPIDFDIVSNPEFLREGAAIEDFMRPNRVVIGADSPQAIAIMKDLYKPLYLIETPIVISNIETSELIKYASNAFLATKISFINEISRLCEKVGADVNVVAKGMGLDNRIGPKFLHAGAGYGGSCFPKDTKALINIGHSHGVDMSVVNAAVKANSRQIEWMSEKIKAAIPDNSGKTIAILGLSFKPNTDDMRDAPSLSIIKDLLKQDMKIRVYDPVAMDNAKKELSGITFCTDAYDACSGADALVIMTEWNQFRNLDMERIRGLLKEQLFFDLRNIYSPEKMRELGFTYYGVGRG